MAAMSAADLALWAAAFILELLLASFICWRRWYVQLPFFSIYIVLLTLRGASLYFVYRTYGYNSRAAFYSFWISQAVLLSGRAAAVGELAWRGGRFYAGFRNLVKWLLPLLGAGLLMRATLAAAAGRGSLTKFVVTLEADLELTAALALLLLLVLAARYRVPLLRAEKGIAAGLLFYSTVQVLNNVVASEESQIHFAAWSLVRMTSFQVALLIWAIVLMRGWSQKVETKAPADLESLRNFVREGTLAGKKLNEEVAQLRTKI